MIIESKVVDLYEIEFLFKLRNSGGTSGGIVNVHISVIRINDENIEQDVIEPQKVR